MAWLSFSTLVGVLYFDLALTPAVLVCLVGRIMHHGKQPPLRR
jgi:hypothetical protein